MEFTIGFCPLEFPGVVFSFEMFMAFGSTEAKSFAIVPDKHHTVSGIDRSRTEIAFFNPHSSTMKDNTL